MEPDEQQKTGRDKPEMAEQIEAIVKKALRGFHGDIKRTPKEQEKTDKYVKDFLRGIPEVDYDQMWEYYKALDDRNDRTG